MNENKHGVAECPFDSSLDSQGQRTSAGPVGGGGGDGDGRGQISAVPMIFITGKTRQRICGKVMFLYVSVCPPSNMGTSGTFDPPGHAPSDTGPKV